MLTSGGECSAEMYMFKKLNTRTTFDSHLTGIYLHHGFVKWFNKTNPELNKVYRKFIEPKMEMASKSRQTTLS